MSKTILFIDGENFLHKLEEVLGVEKSGKNKATVASINTQPLFNKYLVDYPISRKIFYAAKIHIYPETTNKSRELVSLQRKLRNNLVNQGFDFVIAGHVRAQKINGKTLFREKGVDVKIAVDMVSWACDRKVNTAILCSSDSDLQPAVSELRNRGINVIYLGFEINPNKGLSFTTNKTILLKNKDVLSALKRK